MLRFKVSKNSSTSKDSKLRWHRSSPCISIASWEKISSQFMKSNKQMLQLLSSSQQLTIPTSKGLKALWFTFSASSKRRKSLSYSIWTTSQIVYSTTSPRVVLQESLSSQLFSNMSAVITLRAKQSKLSKMSNRKWSYRLNSIPNLKRRSKDKIISLWYLTVKNGPSKILSML